MKIEYLHASKYGNGAMVAEEFCKQMAARGVTVDVITSGRRGRRSCRRPSCTWSARPAASASLGAMRRFLKKVGLPAGTKYAILTTEAAPHPDRTGHVPAEQEMDRWQRVRPIMNEILQRKGLVEVAEDKVQVTEIKGPLEEGWQRKVEAFAAASPSRADSTGVSAATGICLCRVAACANSRTAVARPGHSRATGHARS
jgi:hypothetical protein